jgi:hypothetical protein
VSFLYSHVAAWNIEVKFSMEGLVACFPVEVAISEPDVGGEQDGGMRVNKCRMRRQPYNSFVDTAS